MKKVKAPPKKPIGVSSRNRNINRNRLAWLESKNKAAWLEAKNDNTLTQLDYRQERYKWRFPSEEEHGKRIIHGTPYTWNDNTCSWTMTNVVNTTTPSDDVAAAAAIARTVFVNPTTSAAIAITGQSTAGAALAVAAAAARAIKLPTTIDDPSGYIDDDGTVATETTQDQTNEIYRIQANLDKYATSIQGMSSFLRKLG